MSGALTAGIGGLPLGLDGFADVAAKAVLHGVVQGTLAEVQGGKFGAAFLAAAVSKVGGYGFEQAFPGTSVEAVVAKGVGVAIIGGTVSAIGGGKFANGAATAAFVYTFNCLAHECLRHYVAGSGKGLEARFDELGAERVAPSMFRQVQGLIASEAPDGLYLINDEVSWQTTSLNARAAYGIVTLQAQGWLVVSHGAWSFSGRLSAFPDKYDFDPKPWGVRDYAAEVSTRAGALVPGTPFNNIFVGDRLLHGSGAMK